ncbi:MAG: sulfite exporter TauE/SafE family protein [Synergistaceae bacterium]|nr:sulfite exporter TauE/SafE family protein [Synergistaceae bacterium]
MAKRILKTETLIIGGMTCAACKGRIERKLRSMKGVSEAEVDYERGTGRVVFDEGAAGLDSITAVVRELGYTVSGRSNGVPESKDAEEINNILGAVAIIFALYIFVSHGGGDIFSRFVDFFPQAERGMGYGMLFVVGLLTSLHCVAMCGGINLSQCLGGASENSGADGKKFSKLLTFASLRPSILYNTGRVISYTIVGGVVGALGSVISFSGAARGVVQLVAGVFMVIVGINMLGVFSFLRMLAPRLPKALAGRIERHKSGRGPLYVGLLNGLMPCGPLQAMQLYALYTGNPASGALSMFLFSLGTVPLMFGLGAFGSLMSRRFAGRVMRVGAALVIVMGVMMTNSGISLSCLTFQAAASAPVGVDGDPSLASSSAPLSGAVQEVTTSLTRYGRYQPITVSAGVPVRWTIHAEQGTINGCNNTMIIPAFNMRKRLNVGDNVVEFTPSKPGVYPYSCWMGMIRSTITVVEDSGVNPVSSVRGAAVAFVGIESTFTNYN